MNTSNARWLDELWVNAQLLKQQHLDVLVDATSLDYPLLQQLAEQPDAAKLAKLFENTPEAAIADFGPLLLRVDIGQRDWLKTFINAVDCNKHVVVVFSPWQFEALADHLRGFLQAQWNQGRSEGVLRYYDPRMLLPVTETLTPVQSNAFHAAVISWHWLDRDQQPQSLPGNYVRHAQIPAAGLAWTEADAYRVDRCAVPQNYGLSRNESLIRHLYRSQLAANQKGLLEPEEREPFIEQWLVENSSFVIDEPPKALI
jgi:hypothetical protein